MRTLMLNFASGVAGSTVKCTAVLALVVWTVYATAWLASLTTSRHCPITGSSISRSVISVPEQLGPPVEDNAAPTPSQLFQDSGREMEGRSGAVHQRYSTALRRDAVGNCTMVMLTFRREEILPKVLFHYCKMAIFHRILVIWNDVNTTVPVELLDLVYSCQADLKFIRSKENMLTNRYLPRREIKTDCVCLMDDDRLISKEDMKFGFEVWKTFRHRIVGFEERSFVKKKGKYVYTNYERKRFFSIKTDKSHNANHLPPGYQIEVKDGTRLLHVKNKTFVLGKVNSHLNYRGSTIIRQPDNSSANETKKSEGYNIMLNSCFLHRVYLDMYFDPAIVPRNLIEYVNEKKNCEDILMSIVVTKFLNDMHRPQCGVLAVKAAWIDNLEEEAYEQGGREGLSLRPDHYDMRSACLEKFAAEYGYLPLHTSKVVMSKVSYHL